MCRGPLGHNLVYHNLVVMLSMLMCLLNLKREKLKWNIGIANNTFPFFS